MEFLGNVQLVQGNSRTIESVLNLLKKNGIEPVGNPDVYVREYSSFGVEEARQLAQKAGMRAIISDRRIFIIVTPSMTSEAQNALLKTLEEPPANALFFVVVPSPQLLLPTLRSRAQTLVVEGAALETAINTQEFLRAKPAERLDLLKPLFDKGEDDKRDLASSIEFLAALERELAAQPVKYNEGLEAVYRARKYLGDKGSLAKALLEQVALLI